MNRLVANAMTEKELQKAILQQARLLGWRIAHFNTSRAISDGAYMTAQAGHPGFPDLVLLRPPRLVFVELKTRRGRPTPDQTLWLNGLGAVPFVEQYLWRPDDWQAGRIDEALQ